VAFGPRSLKAAQVERSAHGLRLRAWAVWHEPESEPPGETAGATPAAHPADCAWAGPQIATLLEAVEEFCGSTTACAPPIGLTDLHTLAAPPGTVSERRAMIASQLASVLPRESSLNRQFDYWDALRPTSAPGDQAEVNVVSVPRAYVDELLGGLERAGLCCEVLDARPFVLARALRMAGGSYAHQPVAALEWDRSGTTFCVASGGIPLFTRQLRNCGFERMLAPLAAGLGLSGQEAFEILAAYGLCEGESAEGHRHEVQEAIDELCGQTLEETAEELTKSLEFVRMQFAAVQPQRLCLLGDAAAVANLPRVLEQRLGLPVDVWRPADWLPAEPAGGRIGSQPDAKPAVGAASAEAGDETPPQLDRRPACLAAAITLSALAWES